MKSLRRLFLVLGAVSLRRSTSITKGRGPMAKMIVLAVSMILTLGVVSALPAHAQDLQNDDLLVGAGTPLGAGVIWRLRGGSLDKFCESSDRFFGNPGQVMVDSQGQVVFLGQMPSPSGNFPHYGLFRCSGLGAVPELLAVLAGIGDPTPGDPVPFPGQHFDLVSGLHLARAVAGTIDDQVNDGRPQLGTEDLYVLVVGQFDPTTGQRVGAVRTVQYHTATGRWDEGPVPCVGADCPGPAPCTNCRGTFRAINHGGVAYFTGTALNGGLRRVKDPLRLDISGTLPGGSTFSVAVSLFGGARELGGGTVFDYVNLAHIPSGCPPNPPISNDLPGGFGSVMSEYEVVFDEFGDLGLLLSSPAISAAFPYQANVSEALLDKPGDLTQYFQNPFTGCTPTPAIKTRMIMPFSGPAGSNLVESLVSAPSGIAGTNPSSQLVARLVPGSDQLQVLANRSMFPDLRLAIPSGLGAFPATASVGGVVIVLRVDSQANVVVTGPDGRRIGVDPATGLPVNDFGDDGVDSGPGAPRFFALRNAAPGSYAVQNVATAAGPFAVHVYSADQAQPLGNHIVASGVAAIGDMNNHDFTLDATGGIVFVP